MNLNLSPSFIRNAVLTLALTTGVAPLSATAADLCKAFDLAAARAPKDKPGRVTLLHSEDVTEAAELKRDAELIAKVAHRLGLSVPPQQAYISPSEQINFLATLGGHASPHWKDGAEIVSGLAKAMGVMEFVTAGCPTCRAYYSAGTPIMQQRSIMMHVSGHTDVSSTSRYALIRQSDSPRASYQLAERLRKAYLEENRDEVSLYYQFLNSLIVLQDFVDGTFEPPEKFKPSLTASRTAFHMGSLINTAKAPEQKEWRQSFSPLQVLTQHLPEGAPDYQRDLFKLYEERVRGFPAVFQTKNFNEGWATQMMFILAKYLPWTQSKDLVEFAQLIGMVVRPDFNNPYYLGLTGWQNLYDQFMERPEIVALPDQEQKDIKYIAYARRLYQDKNDSDWARIALDKRWIEKHNLFLFRKFDPAKDAAYGSNDPEKPFIALSRDWRRIQNYVVRTIIDAKYLSTPQIGIKNPSFSDGYIHLFQRLIEDRPLEPHTAAKTSFVISQLMSKPVKLDAVFMLGHNRKSQLRVFPDGRVEAEAEDLDVETARKLAELLQKSVESYRTDILHGLNSDVQSSRTERWLKMGAQIADQNLGSAVKLVDHAPTYAAAVREYLQLVELRLKNAMQNSFNGKAPITPTAKGVRIKVLPEIPMFAYDPRAIAHQKAQKPIAPVDGIGETHNDQFDLDDNGTSVAAGPFLPGDRFGKPKKDGSGKGEGDGKPEEGDEDGDPQDSDPDGESGDPKQGKAKPADPHEIEIPLAMYGEMLADILELPNLRRTGGTSLDKRNVLIGKTRKPSGQLLWDEIVMNGIEKARAIRKSKGLPSDASVPIQDLIREAMPLIESNDYIVKGRREVPRPDYDAVVVVDVDLTGSMSGERIAVAKNTVFNFKALLAATHKNVHVVFVGFSGKAFEMSEKEIFSKFIGSDTNYAAAMEKNKEILARYPTSKFNKFVLTIGDGETSLADAQKYVEQLRELSPDLQYAAFAATNENEVPVRAFFDALQSLKQDWKWVGWTMIPSRDQIFRGLKELFPRGGNADEGAKP